MNFVKNCEETFNFLVKKKEFSHSWNHARRLKINEFIVKHYLYQGYTYFLLGSAVNLGRYATKKNINFDLTPIE